MISETTKYHRTLANYFLSKPLFNHNDKKQNPNTRKLVEQPWQQIYGQLWKELDTTTLCNLDFINASVLAGTIRQLILDYSIAEANCEDITVMIPYWNEWKYFVSGESHIFGEYIGFHSLIVFQQAFNSSRDGNVSHAARVILKKNDNTSYRWFERTNRPIRPPLNPCLFTLADHSATIYSVCITKNGNYIVSASADKTLRIWDTVSGMCVRILTGHTSAVLSVDIVNDKWVISSSWDRTVCIWNIQTGECLTTLTLHSGPVNFVRALNETNFISASLDSAIRIWNCNDQTCHSLFLGHKARINHVISLGNNKFASASDDKSIRIWNTLSTLSTHVLTGHNGAVTYLEWVPGIGLISSSQDGTVRRWDIGSGECVQIFHGHNGPVAGARLLSNDHIVSWSFDYTIRIWSVSTGECLKIIRDHDDPVTFVAILNDDIFASCSQDTNIRLWDRKTFEPAGVLKGHRSWINDMTVHSKGFLVSASSDNTLKIWNAKAAVYSDTDMGNKDAFLPEILLARELTDITFLEKTKAVTYTTAPNSFQVWDLIEGKCVQIVTPGSELENKIWELIKTKHHTHGMSFLGSKPPFEIFGPLIQPVVLREGSPLIVGCILATRAQTKDADWMWRVTSDPEKTPVYPLECKLGRVFDSDLAIFFDVRTREAHILRLH